MENPWKVIAAFIGVFIAGAIFGGVFSIGIGARWMTAVTPAAPAATAPVAVPSPSPVPEAPAPAKAAPRPAPQGMRQPLLQIPQTWQAPMLMRRYAEQLGLTPEQKERIMPLFQRATEDYRRVQQNTFRETAIILQRLAEDISKELSPDQRQRLEQWEEKRREALQKIEARPGQKKAGPAAHPGGAAKPANANPPTPAPTAKPPAESSATSSSSAGTTAAPSAGATQSGTSSASSSTKRE